MNVPHFITWYPRSSLTLSLAEIISGCCKNNRDAQRLLFDHISPKVMTVCRRYAYNAEESRDLFQECFYQLLKSIDKYDDQKGEFEGWAYRLCYNTILNVKKKSVQFYELNDSILEVHQDQKPEYPINKEMLLKEIQNLPEGYRMILNLYVFEGLTHEEIAQVLNIAESTSRSQLARARVALKKKLFNKNPQQYVSGSI